MAYIKRYTWIAKPNKFYKYYRNDKLRYYKCRFCDFQVLKYGNLYSKAYYRNRVHNLHELIYHVEEYHNDEYIKIIDWCTGIHRVDHDDYYYN